MSRIDVGFIGLGHMGKPLAKNLIGAAFDTWMYDVYEPALAELVALGARASTPAEIARNCSLIGICVRDDKDVDALLYGEQGMLANAQADAVIAIHSTVTRNALMRWARDAGARGVHLIDAPVTRGNGELGDEVTANVRTIRRLPLRLEGAPERLVVRGEIFMPRPVFDQLNRERLERGEPLYANPRNTTAGTVRQLDSREVARRRLDVPIAADESIRAIWCCAPRPATSSIWVWWPGWE